MIFIISINISINAKVSSTDILNQEYVAFD